MLTFSKTYEIIRESGFIALPFKRTLQDYTHWTKLQPGFNANFLKKEMNVDGPFRLGKVLSVTSELF